MIEYILFVVGIFLLIKGANYLVDGSSSLAKKLRVPTIVIGLTIVAFGTSMPEFVVNIISAIKGSSDIAFGNIIGSNIANILLILGISGIIRNLKIQHSTIWGEIPFSLLAVIVLLIFANTLVLDKISLPNISRFEGLILLSFFGVFLCYIVKLVKRNKSQMKDDKLEIKKLSSLKIALFILGGLVALFFGGKWTVEGAVSLAKLLGLSEYFIGLTIVAVGTSLPELFTSVIATMKRDADLAVGNVIGSNIFNIFWILGITALILPISLPLFANIDLFILLGTTFLVFLFMFIGKKHELERWQGILFVLIYVAYTIFLINRG